jgi:hypothetical protein
MKWRVRWSHVTIALAVIAALAIASPVFGLDKGIKKAIKKEVAKQIGKATGPPGPAGANGSDGQDATKLFAYIRDNGSADTATVQYPAVVAVFDPAGNSFYQLFFNQSIVNCVVQAVAGAGNPRGTAAIVSSFPTVDLIAGNQALVTFSTDAGAVTDTSFMITAFC